MSRTGTSYLYLDANALIHCRSLRELPWRDLGIEGDIVLAITETAVSEIDKHGYSDREYLAKRARSIKRLFRSLEKNGGNEQVAECVELALLPLHTPAAFNWVDGLSKESADDQLLAEILAHTIGLGDSKTVFTYDSVLSYRARRLCEVKKVPESWLRAPEESRLRSRLVEYEQRLKALESRVPVLAVQFCDIANDSSPEPLETIECSRVELLRATDVDIDKSLQELMESHPMPEPYPDSKLGTSSALDDRYEKEIREHYLEKQRRYLESMAEFLECLFSSYVVAIEISNSGQAPADIVRIRVRCTSGLQVITSLPSFEVKAPWGQKNKHSILTGGGYRFSPAVLDAIEARNHVLSAQLPVPVLDRSEHPRSLGNERPFCEFMIQQLRHGDSAYVLGLLVPGRDVAGGHLAVEVSAENLPKQSNVKVPVKVMSSDRTVDILSELREASSPRERTPLRVGPA